MQDIILDLLKTAREPRTVEELIHELTVMRRHGLIQCEQPSEAAVGSVLRVLESAGRVRRYGVEWRYLPENRQPLPSQGSLFA